jgi:electron transfer flavoprotein alpha subunit
MRKIAVLVDLVDGGVDDTARELATAARAAGDVRVTGFVLGSDLAAILPEISRWFDEVVAVDDAMLSVPDGDVAAAVLAPLLEREAPFCILAAHTNHAMDYVPALAVRLDRPLVTDCLSVDLGGETVSAVRPAYGGKVHARVTAAPSGNGYMATMRPGSVKPGACPEAAGAVRHEAVPDGISPRRRFVETVAGDAGGVDISLAERLVAVGRGLEDQDSLAMIEALAAALGAEVACSRPVVDRQWLPKNRQVGTSGKTVRPKLYLAIGISGSFQHLGGIKGNPYVVAINKDPKAPIFSVADVGIVADLYDVVPLLGEKIQSIKG